ncbi:xanthine dehydrogenase family protein subunit M, partial [Pseudomonas syringae pv. tagetis]
PTHPKPIPDPRIPLRGVATKPSRAVQPERALTRQPADKNTFVQAAELAMKSARAYAHNAFQNPLGQQGLHPNLRDLTA